MGNSIARINPTSGEIEGFVFVGSEPGKLALADDGRTLYVSLDGAAAVRSFDITTQTPGVQFTLGESLSSGPFFVKDLAVAPGIPDLVAVSRRNRTSSPDFEGVAVYEAGVRRSLTTPRHTGSEFIAFSNSGIYSAWHWFGSGTAKDERDFLRRSVVSTSPTSGGDFKDFVTRLEDEFSDLDQFETRGRRLAEMLALGLQGSLLVQHAPVEVADAFCASRLDGDTGLVFGTLPANTMFQAIIERSRPKV